MGGAIPEINGKTIGIYSGDFEIAIYSKVYSIIVFQGSIRDYWLSDQRFFLTNKKKALNLVYL